MTTTKELRIGNYVLVDSLPERVLSIANTWIETTTYHMIHSFSGIPLTEDVMAKCLQLSNTIDDQEDDIELLAWFNQDASFSIELIPDELGIGCNYVVTLYQSEINSEGELISQGTHDIEFKDMALHELQNIYWGLYHEELEFNLKS